MQVALFSPERSGSETDSGHILGGNDKPSLRAQKRGRDESSASADSHGDWLAIVLNGRL